MKVTPVKKKFGKYEVGTVFDLPDQAARLFIKVGKLSQVHTGGPVYQTRMMQAEPVAVVTPTTEVSVQTVQVAPYGYKADGTPRKRPGRVAK